MLTRSQLLIVSNYTEARFQNLSQRGFSEKIIPGEEDASEAANPHAKHRYSRRTYSPLHAVSLRLLSEMTRDGGESVDLASSIIGNLSGMIKGELRRLLELGAEEIWAGAMFFAPEGRAHMCTTLEGWFRASQPGEGHNTDYDLSRMVMVNVTRAVRDVEEAGLRANIALDWNA